VAVRPVAAVKPEKQLPQGVASTAAKNALISTILKTAVHS